MEYQKTIKKYYKKTNIINTKKSKKMKRVSKVSKKYKKFKGGGKPRSVKSKSSSKINPYRARTNRKQLGKPRFTFVTKALRARKLAKAKAASFRSEIQSRPSEIQSRPLPRTPVEMEQMRLMEERIKKAQASTKQNANETLARQYAQAQAIFM